MATICRRVIILSRFCFLIWCCGHSLSSGHFMRGKKGRCKERDLNPRGFLQTLLRRTPSTRLGHPCFKLHAMGFEPMRLSPRAYAFNTSVKPSFLEARTLTNSVTHAYRGFLHTLLYHGIFRPLFSPSKGLERGVRSRSGSNRRPHGTL